MAKKPAERMEEEFWKGADLAMEIVSDAPEDRRRDLVTKRSEYAQAGMQAQSSQFSPKRCCTLHPQFLAVAEPPYTRSGRGDEE